MIKSWKTFWKNNFSWWHVLGMFVCMLFAILYWHYAGRYSEYIIKNNIFLVIVWGLMLGYVTIDLAINASKRNSKEKNEEDTKRNF